MAHWTRKSILGAVTVAAITAAGMLAACSSDAPNPAAPVAAPSAAAFSRAGAANVSDILAQGLLWEKPRTAATSASNVIGPQGGEVNLGETGLKLEVPRGAVLVNTRFTVTALPGSVVAYEFEPHGALFPVPLTFQQDLGKTNIGHVHLPPGFNPNIEGAYFSSSAAIDQSTGVAAVKETIPASSEWTFNGKAISFPIWHFSGYLVSTGRGGF